jgi:hypothetical protein
VASFLDFSRVIEGKFAQEENGGLLFEHSPAFGFDE